MRSLWQQIGRDVAVCLLAWVGVVAAITSVREVGVRQTDRAARVGEAERYYVALRDCPSAKDASQANCDERVHLREQGRPDEESEFYLTGYLLARLYGLESRDRERVATAEREEDSVPARSALLAEHLFGREPVSVAVRDAAANGAMGCETLQGGAKWLCRVTGSPEFRVGVAGLDPAGHPGYPLLADIGPRDIQAFETEDDRANLGAWLTADGPRIYRPIAPQ